MHRKFRYAAVPAAVLALALSATACEEDNTDALNAWAKAVCEPAKGHIKNAQLALADTGRVEQGEDPADLQTRLSEDLGKLVNATNGLAEAIDSAGPPKTSEEKEGQRVQEDAVRELRASAKGYSGVKDDVDGLNADDQEEFAAGLQRVGGDMRKASSKSATALKRLQKGELGNAVARQKGCARIDPAELPTPSPSVSPSGAESEKPGDKPSSSPSKKE